MTDIFDQATEKEEQFRESALQAARSFVDEHPDVGCLTTCPDIDKNGKDCADYRYCLEDWLAREGAKQRNGRVD